MSLQTVDGKKILTFKRVIDAPRERVRKAWTDPKQFAKWWGPHGLTAPVCELDVRPGGNINVHMKGPDGSPFAEPMPMALTVVVLKDSPEIAQALAGMEEGWSQSLVKFDDLVKE